MGNRQASFHKEQDSSLEPTLSWELYGKQVCLCNVVPACGERLIKRIHSHPISKEDEASFVLPDQHKFGRDEVSDGDFERPALADDIITESNSESFELHESRLSPEIIFLHETSGSLNRDARIDLVTSRCSTDGREDLKDDDNSTENRSTSQTYTLDFEARQDDDDARDLNPFW